MGNFRGGFNAGGFGGANLGQLMKQAQKMQQNIEEKKNEIVATEFKASAGGGMVEVIMQGDRTLKSIKFKPEIIDPDDIEMLEDLVIASINDALAQIAKKEGECMPNLAGMGI